LIFYSVQLRFIGLRFAERDRSQVPRLLVDQLEALYEVIASLALVDVLVGASLTARFMVLAFRSGYRAGVVAAMTFAATQLASRGGPISEREIILVRLAKDMYARAADELARSRTGAEDAFADAPFRDEPQQAVEAINGVRYFLHGLWKEAYEACETAYTKLPAARGTWNVHALAVYGEYARVLMGDVADLAVRLPRLLADAERRGDMLKIVNLRTGVAPIVFLAKDDPGAARRHVLDGMAQWSQAGFLIQHWRAMIAEVDIDLYDQKGIRAYDCLARHRGAMRRSFLAMAQYVHAITAFAAARAAVASAYELPKLRRRRLREAGRLSRQLERGGLPWMSALAS
jgi:hypothetical protein